MSFIDRTSQIPKFGGEIHYVNAGTGNDANGGKRPKDALATIGQAITNASAGDAINVKAGSYDENGLDMNLAGMELWAEIGVTLANTTPDTCLTVSGAGCKITGHLKITVSATKTGLSITGNECYLQGLKILDGAIGIIVTGQGVYLEDCAVGLQTTTSYDIQGVQGRLFRCKTVGTGATIGYKINGGVDTGVLEQCTSSGHTTAGFSIATGSQDWTLLNCSSGGSDGKWVDVDSANIWSGFTYPETKYKQLTLDNSHAYNLFKVTGSVEIIGIFGHVTTVLAGANTDCYWQLYSSAGDDNITKVTDGDLGAASVGTVIIKTENPAKAFTVLTATTPSVDKTADPKKRGVFLTADEDQDTYIRWVCDGNDDTSGAIHFHIVWEPLTDAGFLEPV